MATKERLAAADAYAKALATGDKGAAAAADKHIAQDVVSTVGNRTFEGHDEVLSRITGVWPQTPVYRNGTWGAAKEAGSDVVVNATMKPVGAGPAEVNVTFGFNDSDQINKVNLENIVKTQLVETDVLPDFISSRINTALANDTPLSVTYVGKDGKPKISLRGSVRTYGDHSLSIWARKDSGLAEAVGTNPSMSFLFRDNPTRSTIILQGTARVDTDPAIRKQIFDESPEVEQNHESWEAGAAVIIDLDQVDGGTPDGRVKFRR